MGSGDGSSRSELFPRVQVFFGLSTVALAFPERFLQEGLLAGFDAGESGFPKLQFRP